jgi:RalA-binding protein 1
LREDTDDIQSKRQNKSRVGAEEFPLPPPSNIFLQRQQALAAQEAQVQLYAQRNPQQQQPLQIQQPVPASSPSKHMQAMSDQYPHGSPHHTSNDSRASLQESTYTLQDEPLSVYCAESSSNQPQEKQESTIQAVPASFRALPLLSSDLPHTHIVVSHSFVRPNDRGKEVLSFIVFVNPGHGKEGWKVEKMYSDVLSLDQRVRNSVGKGVGKKIANLPDGKLWKDHAPAKVDQRKVSCARRFHEGF